MVKRTITITTVLLILTMAVSLIIVLNKSSLAAENEVVITFNANGGTFESGLENNVLTHAVNSANPIYIHSSNWTDDGELKSGYMSNSYPWIEAPKVYTIEGASSLHLNIVYGSQKKHNDACYIVPGNATNIDFNKVKDNFDLLPEGSVKLQAKDDKAIIVEDLVIPGDTVTISVTDDHGTYGHFITISGDTLQNGEYKEPIPNTDNKKFTYWNTEPDGHGISYYGNTLPNKSMTLYAQYVDNDVIDSGVFRDVNWRLDKSGSLILGLDGEEQTFSEENNEISTSHYYPWNTYYTAIKDVHFEGTVHGASNMSSLFGGWYQYTETVDVHGFDTSNVTKMDWLFSGMGWEYTWEETGPYLTFLHLDEMDVSNVKTMERMFEEVAVTSLDLRPWDVSNVECFSDMFLDCGRATMFDVRGWDTSNATDMYRMFGACTNVEEIRGYEDFDTSNSRNLAAFFMSDSKLTHIDVTKWDTSKNEDFGSMFDSLELLTEIDVSNFDVSSGIDFSFMFWGCKNLTHIDTSNWHTGNIFHLGDFVAGCSSLKELDMSGFNCTTAATSTTYPFGVYDVFKDCPNLKRVILPDTFRFINPNDTRFTSILPTPSNEYPYKGTWVREDRAYGPMSAEELKQQYNAEMAGVWIWDAEFVESNVSYSYVGEIPNGASSLPSTKKYAFGDNVEVEPDASAPGYTFSGWSRTGTFEMPAEDVEITGSFTPNTDTPYTVEHYLEDITEGSYTLTKTDSLTGTTDTEAEATAKEYEGFTFDNTIEGTKQSGNIAGDGSLVLKLYYKRNSYNVTYAYTGDVPDGASELPQSVTYKYGEEIKVPENATAEGYTFSGWIKDYINMPAKDIEITGYFIKEPRLYKIEYYFDNELDEALVEILNAEKDEEINLTPQTPVKHGEKNYTLVSNNHNIVVSVNDEDNIIRVYYETDVLDYAIDNFEDTTEGDGIPDKYQISITYKVENGSWNDGTKGTKIDIITLKDKDGNLSEEGTGTTTIPEVGNKPSEEYEVGSWNEEIPIEVSNKDNGKEYIYSYKKSEKQNIEQKEDKDITEASGKIYNPKTDDIVNKYLLVGIGGILVLAVVNKIRRKYSRKARKIQF